MPADERLIVHTAWIRMAEVRRHLKSWFRAEDPRLRRTAYRLAVELRLGDLAEPLASALVWEYDAESLRAGTEAARTLGSLARPPQPQPTR